MVLKCQGALELPGGFVKPMAGLHPQSFWSLQSGVGPRICVSHAIPGDADGATLENHYPKECISGKSESFKIKSSD